MDRTSARSASVPVAQVSEGLFLFGWASMLGATVFLAVTASDRAWVSLDNLRQAALVFGGLLGLWVVVATMGVVVRGPRLTIRGFWYTWSGSPWAVRGAMNHSGLVLATRQDRGHGPEDRLMEVAAVQGSVLEQLRGNVRAAGAIRRLRNAQAATPVADGAQLPLRRRLRLELGLWVPAMAAMEWLLVSFLWSRG